MKDIVYLNPPNKDTLYSDRGISYTDVWIGENSSGYIYLKSVHFTICKLYLNLFFIKKGKKQGLEGILLIISKEYC